MKNVCHAIVISSAEGLLDICLCKQNHYLIVITLIGSNRIELRSEDEEQELDLHWNVIQLNSSGHSPSHPAEGWTQSDLTWSVSAYSSIFWVSNQD